MEKTALEELQLIIDKLTAPDGCPWDKEQTPESLTEYIIEESHELVSAIRSGDVAEIREELGDVAFLLLVERFGVEGRAVVFRQARHWPCDVDDFALLVRHGSSRLLVYLG